MTPAERKDISILNGSRRQRIAKGSGNTVQAVNELVDRFEQAKKMMEAMSAAMYLGRHGAGKAAEIGAAAAVGLISLLTALLTLVFTWPTRRRRERTADQRSAFESTRLRWAREEDAQLR